MDLNNEKNYSAGKAYGYAKLENILFTRELQRRFGEKGIHAVAFEPGIVRSNFGSESKPFINFAYHSFLKYFFTISPEKSAKGMVALAHGKPGVDFEVGETYTVSGREFKVKFQDKDGKVAKKLWEKCEEWMGEKEINMLRLRTYKTCDAKTILTWCKDEISFRKWTSDRYDSFPITDVDMNYKYVDCNGDCAEEDNFFPMTAFDENGVVGHLIMRFTDEKKTVLRLGFVIVDDSKRGKGYGKEMINLALKYAFEIMKVEKVTIGVFENNAPAYHCYKAAGFKEVDMAEDILCEVCGEKWKIRELEMEAKDFEDRTCVR